MEISPSAARAAQEVRIGMGRLRRRFREVTDRDGLTPSQTMVLSRLSKDGPSTASALAAAERVRPQSAAAWLAHLEEHGMIERRPDPDDGRRQLVSLTVRGHEFVDGTRRGGEEWLARAMEEKFTEAERDTVIDAMALLHRLLEP